MKKKQSTAKQNQSNTIRLIIVVIALALLVVVASWHLTSSVSKQIIKTNIESMKELSLHDRNSIKTSIVLRLDSMEGIGRNLTGRKYAGMDELLSAMRDLVQDIPSASKISLLDSEGVNYLSSGVVEKDSSIAQVCAAKTERFVTRQNTTAHFHENVKEVLFEAIPIDFTLEGKHFVWLICQYPIDTLENELRITSYNGAGYSSVIDENGDYIINMSRSHSFLDRDNFFEDMKEAELEGYSSFAEMFANPDADTVIYSLNNVRYIMVYSDMKISSWKFISTVPVSVFDAQTNSIITIFLILLGVIALFLGGLFLLSLQQRKQRTELKISEAASKSKTEFLFNMSHDIRTPMNAILGNTDIAIKHQDSPQRVKESLEKIKISGEHLLSLINDILEMSRIESGKLEISEEPMDLRKLVKSVQQMSSSLAIEKSIEFKTEIGEMNHPYVYTDALHANEVLINLISNAIKYTPDGGDVTFKAEQIGRVQDGKIACRFIIADNGIGMSEEFQHHLFEAFSREKTSTVSKQEGAGLGLSIVKRIVDLAGGTISVQSKQNEGSTFVVELPLRVMDEEAIRKYEAENKPLDVDENQFGLKHKKVLLVEDNEINREIATEILEEVGLWVETAEDGELAVKAVIEKGTSYYDFILMDIQMPVMDGYEATKIIRAMPGGDKVIIIALSANAFKEDIDKSLAIGMNAHVAKPIHVKTLYDTMQKLLTK